MTRRPLSPAAEAARRPWPDVETCLLPDAEADVDLRMARGRVVRVRGRLRMGRGPMSQPTVIPGPVFPSNEGE